MKILKQFEISVPQLMCCAIPSRNDNVRYSDVHFLFDKVFTQCHPYWTRFAIRVTSCRPHLPFLCRKTIVISKPVSIT